VRSENEDTIYCSAKEGLFVLADGMGGHSSGRHASEKAVTAIRQYLTEQRHAPDSQWPFDPSPKLSDLGNHEQFALRIANVRVYNEAQKNEDLLGMGTTGLLFVADERQGVIAHVGDSRCYVHDGKALERVTNDHSLIN
jgi:protein phosphatase